MNLGGSSSPSPAPAPAATPAAALGPYPDDGSRRMPVYNSQASLEAGRRRRREIVARSGRESTRLAGTPGTMSYQNTALGDAG